MLDHWARAAYRKAKSEAGDLADRTNRPVTFWLDDGRTARFDDPPPRAATETLYPRLRLDAADPGIRQPAGRPRR